MNDKPSMTTDDFLKLAKKGRDAWNEWAEANPDEAVSFGGVEFSEDIDFSGFKFPADISFSEAQFGGITLFSEAQFSSVVWFSEAQFSSIALFDGVEFGSSAYFDGTGFFYIPNFNGVANDDRIIFYDVDFKLPMPANRLGKVIYAATGLCTVDRSVDDQIRVLRGIANKTYAIDVERDLSILERNAQASAAWGEIRNLEPLTWVRKLSAAIVLTMPLLLYRWSSNYGRSFVLPLLLLFVTPSVWFGIYRKIYLSVTINGVGVLPELKVEALKSIAMSNAFPIGNALRPAYTTALETLFGKSGAMPMQFQIALTMQNVGSLILLFLIGLALRNFFRLR